MKTLFWTITIVVLVTILFFEILDYLRRKKDFKKYSDNQVKTEYRKYNKSK